MRGRSNTLRRAREGFRCGLVSALVCGVVGCSGVPSGLPGTATCTTGMAERTYLCRDICADATRARSEDERRDITECARSECGLTCGE